MKFSVKVTPQAHAEVTGAAAAYESLRPGWGNLFIDEYEHAVAQIGNFPESYQEIASSCRRVVLHRFPFFVVYRLRPRLIEIIGLFPAQSNPRLMMTRIERSSH